MPTLAQVRNRVDDWLAQRWQTVKDRQEAYFGNQGHYWQGLRTHALAPQATSGAYADSPATHLASHPTDQLSSWLDRFPEFDGLALPCCLHVDVYDSPAGHGWRATVEVFFNGTLYRRTANVGPETDFTSPWHVVTGGL